MRINTLIGRGWFGTGVGLSALGAGAVLAWNASSDVVVQRVSLIQASQWPRAVCGLLLVTLVVTVLLWTKVVRHAMAIIETSPLGQGLKVAQANQRSSVASPLGDHSAGRSGLIARLASLRRVLASWFSG